jgi:hypothetical protein
MMAGMHEGILSRKQHSEDVNLLSSEEMEAFSVIKCAKVVFRSVSHPCIFWH